MKGCTPIGSNIRGGFTIHGKPSPRDVCLYTLGVKTGFRYAELRSLTIGDVLRDQSVVNSIYVQRKNVKGKTEGQHVPLHEDARQAIFDYLAERHPYQLHEPLFLSQKRNPLSRPQFARLLKRAARASVVNDVKTISTHSMRKTFARKMQERFGPDVFKIQQAMRHKHINSTASYLSFDQEEINSAILNS